jgi:hypothetical protein
MQGNAPAEAGPQKRPRKFFGVGIVVVVAVAAAVPGVAAAVLVPIGFPNHSGPAQLGPYMLDPASPSVVFSPRECQVVTIHWRITMGSEANFTVYPPVARDGGNCASSHSATNASCLPIGCNDEDNPICFEVGQSGSCSFESTEQFYTAELWAGDNETSGSSVVFSGSIA